MEVENTPVDIESECRSGCLRRFEEISARVHELLEQPDDAKLNEYVLTLRPADVAQVAERLTDVEPRRRVFSLLTAPAAARVIEESRVDVQRALLRGLPTDRLRAILEHMSADDLADLAGSLLPDEARSLLDLIPEDAAEIRALMAYPEDTAGGLMTPELVRLRETQTAAEAIEHIRKRAPIAETIYYLYVTDEKRRLSGVISLRQLIIADPSAFVGELMDRQVICVPVTMDQEEVAQALARYDLLAVPVVATNHVLVGVITVDDVLDVVQDEATRDIQQMGGSTPLEQPYLQSRVWSLINSRVWWLLLLFVLQSLTLTIMDRYGAAMESVILLAVFIPLLIDTAGNAGSQASTLVIRALAVEEVRWGDFLRVIWRETLVGLTLGMVMALATIARALLLGSPLLVAYTVSLTILLIVLAASVIGGALPLLIKRVKLDPAVASAPLITTLADTTGLLLYFTIATWMLGLSR